MAVQHRSQKALAFFVLLPLFSGCLQDTPAETAGPLAFRTELGLDDVPEGAEWIIVKAIGNSSTVRHEAAWSTHEAPPYTKDVGGLQTPDHPLCVLYARYNDSGTDYALGMSAAESKEFYLSEAPGIQASLNTSTLRVSMLLGLPPGEAEGFYYLFAHNLLSVDGAMSEWTIGSYDEKTELEIVASGTMDCLSDRDAFDEGDFQQVGLAAVTRHATGSFSYAGKGVMAYGVGSDTAYQLEVVGSGGQEVRETYDGIPGGFEYSLGWFWAEPGSQWSMDLRDYVSGTQGLSVVAMQIDGLPEFTELA